MISRLETKRLLLNPYTAADAPALHRILGDPMTMQFWPSPFTADMTGTWISRALTSYQEMGFGRLAVFERESGQLIGDCGLIRVSINGRDENDLGYIFSKEYWGQGYATEAARECLRWGFETLKLERIVANMEVTHAKSLQVALRLGFKIETEFINQRNRNRATYLLSLYRNQ